VKLVRKRKKQDAGNNDNPYRDIIGIPEDSGSDNLQALNGESTAAPAVTDILDDFDSENYLGFSVPSSIVQNDNTEENAADSLPVGIAAAPVESLIESESHVGDTVGFLMDNNEPEKDKLEDSIKTIKKTTKSIFGPFSVFFGFIYRFIYFFGIQFFRYGKRFFVRVNRQAVKPFLYAAVLLRALVIAVDRLFFVSVHAVHEEGVVLRKEIRKSSKYLLSAVKKDPLSVFPILKHYIKKAVTSHKEMFKSAFNLALPVMALVVFWLTVSYWNSVTYSLKVTYQGNSLGYIQDESVFVSARAMVNERLAANSNVEATADAGTKKAASVDFGSPTYKLALVKLNQLSDDETICDKIIDQSKSEFISACGIYINGSLKYIVKNEADANGVLDNILAPYKNRSTAIVAFVDDVKIKQGLYLASASEIWTAEKLEKTLEGTNEYIAKAGDTLWDICQNFGLTENEIRLLNPDMGAYIHEGDTIIVSGSAEHLRVKTIITETREETIKYEIKEINSPSLFEGDSRIIRKGENGTDRVTELVTYIDGVRAKAKEIDRLRIKDAVAEKVEIGTKSTTVYSRDGSYTVTVSKEGFVWPVPNCRSVSSYFGYRSSGYHDGIDISGTGTGGKTIVAAKDGVVESVQSGGTLGMYIIINHGDGIKTGYGHCRSGSVAVSPGQHVSAGQKIAEVGTTGNATGPHLHFNVIINGSNSNPMNYVG